MSIDPLTSASKKRIESVLERALNDIEFREKLVVNPQEALKDCDLTEKEREVVGGLRRVQLEEWGVDVRKFRMVLADNGFKM